MWVCLRKAFDAIFLLDVTLPSFGTDGFRQACLWGLHARACIFRTPRARHDTGVVRQKAADTAPFFRSRSTPEMFLGSTTAERETLKHSYNAVPSTGTCVEVFPSTFFGLASSSLGRSRLIHAFLLPHVPHRMEKILYWLPLVIVYPEITVRWEGGGFSLRVKMLFDQAELCFVLLFDDGYRVPISGRDVTLSRCEVPSGNMSRSPV